MAPSKQQVRELVPRLRSEHPFVVSEIPDFHRPELLDHRHQQVLQAVQSELVVRHRQ